LLKKQGVDKENFSDKTGCLYDLLQGEGEKT
jgi:hypothetical protein